jgi:hypothetical protein
MDSENMEFKDNSKDISRFVIDLGNINNHRLTPLGGGGHRPLPLEEGSRVQITKRVQNLLTHFDRIQTIALGSRTVLLDLALLLSRHSKYLTSIILLSPLTHYWLNYNP